MNKHDIIIISAEPWEHCTWRRRHHVAWNLAKNNRVLFVEPPLTVRQPFSAINLNWRHLLNLGRFKYQGRNLYSYSPVRLFPLSFPGSKRFNYYEIDKQRTFNTLNKIVKKLEFKNPILWVFHNNYQYHYYGLFNEKIVVTDWYDDFSGLTGAEVSNDYLERVRQKELKLLNKSDIIFVPCEEMRNKLSKYRDDLIVVHHGVDFDLYQEKKYDSKKIKFLRKLKKPVLCYLGTIRPFYDFDLLEYISHHNPNWSILLIGKEWINNREEKKKFLNLIQQKNVFYCKEVSRKLVPYYLFYSDVCLIPFKRAEICYIATAPLKLWEYFAAGKPVVATDLGRDYLFPELIKTAKDYDDFCEKVREAIVESDNEIVIKRKEIAEKSSWSVRVQKMVQIIENYLSIDE